LLKAVVADLLGHLDILDEALSLIGVETGGINFETAKDFLALPNVACVGGSWVAPAKLVAAGDWAGIEALARESAALPR
jgi:2-keto-3-deoxy-6-phosphogluconate aldolase